MWSFIKNLSTGKYTFSPAEDLFVIQESGKEWLRATFRGPTFNNKTEMYAREENGRMVRCYILALEDSKEELEQKVAKTRPKVDKRFSVSDTTLKVSLFKTVEELKIAKETSKGSVKVDKARAKVLADAEVIKRHNKKVATVKKDKEQDKVHKESEGGDGKTEVLELEVKGSSKVEDKEAEHVLIDHNERDEIIIDKGVTTSSNDNSECTGISNEDTSSKDNDKASNVPDNLKCSKKCMERVKSLQEKVDSCTDKYRQMKRKVIKLETENKLLKDQSQGLLTQLSKEIKKSQVRKINNNAFQSSICKVKSIALEEQFSEVSWNEETEIYVGEGKVITRKAVDVIDDQLTSFNSRGVAVLELMLDDKLSNYSKTGHSGSGETLKCIPKTHITALKKIMRSMSWGDTSEDCSDKKFRDFLNKQPNEERRKLERKATGGKSKVGQKGNPKQKKAVKRDSEDISSETTSNKKSKVIEESVEDSLSDEKETSNKKSKVNEESDEDALSDEKETPEDLDSSNFLLNYSTSSET